MRYGSLLVRSPVILALVLGACEDVPSVPDAPRAPELETPATAVVPQRQRAEGYAARGEVRSGYILDRSGQPRRITFEIHEGLAIWEGDIIIGRAGEVPTSSQALLRRIDAAPRGGIVQGVYVDGDSKRWPGGVMPYEIDPAVSDHARITDAIAWIEESTAGVTVVPRSGQGDYVRFVDSDGCSSPIGKQGGKQEIKLGDDCSTGNAAHEMLHSLGMFHEQSRCDRNDFVTINIGNVEDGREGNFDRECSGATDFPADVYDEGSIMHYGTHFFSKNGDPTIESKRGLDHLMGQRSQLSDVDVQTVNHLYGHHNQAPTAVIGSLASGYPEGSSVAFDGSGSSDPDDSALQYSWDFGDGSCSGGTPPAECSAESPSHVYADDGTYTATLTVSDGFLSHATSASVVVTNVAPVVSAGPDATRNEGSLLSRPGSFTDPGADTWSATVDYGDGSGIQPLALAGTSFTLSHSYEDDGSYTVTVSVADEDGGVGTDLVVVTVSNVAPTVNAGPDATVTSGEAYQLSGTFSDPGILDAPWNWQVQWGFGPNSSGQASDQSAPILASQSVCAAGTYTVVLSVTDKDGGVGTDDLLLTVPYVAVGIDVKPGEGRNPINRRSRGRLPVAILGSATFDARGVDPSKVVLGDEAGTDTPVARQNNGRYHAHREDVNGDGRVDLVVMFEVPALVANGDLPETATSLVLRGFLDNGCTNFRGVDTVVIVP